MILFITWGRKSCLTNLQLKDYIIYLKNLKNLTHWGWKEVFEVSLYNVSSHSHSHTWCYLKGWRPSDLGGFVTDTIRDDAYCNWSNSNGWNGRKEPIYNIAYSVKQNFQLQELNWILVLREHMPYPKPFIYISGCLAFIGISRPYFAITNKTRVHRHHLWTAEWA